MLVDAARVYLDVPFKHQGRSKNGLDCVGLIIVAAKDCGLEFPDCMVYSKSPQHGLLQQNIEKSGFLERLHNTVELKRNDILLFRFTEEPQHVALYCDNSIIHSYSRIEKVVEHRFSGSWKHKLVCVYRLKREIYEQCAFPKFT